MFLDSRLAEKDADITRLTNYWPYAAIRWIKRLWTRGGESRGKDDNTNPLPETEDSGLFGSLRAFLASKKTFIAAGVMIVLSELRAQGYIDNSTFMERGVPYTIGLLNSVPEDRRAQMLDEAAG